MDHQDSMQNQMMVMKMQKHQTLIYTFDVLVLVGLVSIIVLLAKILKAHRR